MELVRMIWSHYKLAVCLIDVNPSVQTTTTTKLQLRVAKKLEAVTTAVTAVHCLLSKRGF